MRVEHSGGIQASLSGRYALALFELARDADQLDKVSKGLESVKAVLADSDDFRRLIASPLVTRDEAVAAIAGVSKSLKLDSLTANFLGVLATNRRLAELGAAISAFNHLASAHRGEVTADVTSAHALDAKQTAALKAKLKGEFSKDVALNLTIDPEILGGLIVKVGSRQVDGSIRTKLNTLAQAMKG